MHADPALSIVRPPFPILYPALFLLFSLLFRFTSKCIHILDPRPPLFSYICFSQYSDRSAVSLIASHFLIRPNLQFASHFSTTVARRSLLLIRRIFLSNGLL